MCPDPALDVDALKNTVSLTPGDDGEKVKVAVGAVEPDVLTLTGFVTVVVWPASSRTVNTIENVPVAL